MLVGQNPGPPADAPLGAGGREAGRGPLTDELCHPWAGVRSGLRRPRAPCARRMSWCRCSRVKTADRRRQWSGCRRLRVGDAAIAQAGPTAPRLACRPAAGPGRSVAQGPAARAARPTRSRSTPVPPQQREAGQLEPRRTGRPWIRARNRTGARPALPHPRAPRLTSSPALRPLVSHNSSLTSLRLARLLRRGRSPGCQAWADHSSLALSRHEEVTERRRAAGQRISRSHANPSRSGPVRRRAMWTIRGPPRQRPLRSEDRKGL